LGVLQLLTSELVGRAGVNSAGLSCTDEGDERYWQQEALDMLLEVRCGWKDAWTVGCMTERVVT
jgi:hypothetical protein